MLPDKCKQHIKDWHFTMAFDDMGDEADPRERETLYALAMTFGNIGFHQGEMGVIVGAVVRSLIGEWPNGRTAAPQPVVNRANVAYVNMASRYDEKARDIRDVLDDVYKHIKAPKDDQIHRKDDFSDVKEKGDYIKRRWDELRAWVRENA